MRLLHTKRSSNSLSFAAAVVFALFVQFGPLGFGVDVHQSYQYAEARTVGFEPVGWYVASLRLDLLDSNYYIGAAATSFLISFGLFTFSQTVLCGRIKYFYVVVTCVLLLFSHPVILGGTNALRQGVSCGFFFLFLSNFLLRKNAYVFIFAMASVLSHNSALLLIIPFVIMILSRHCVIKSLLAISYIALIFGAADSLSGLKSSINTGIDYKFILILLMTLSFTVFVLLFDAYRSRHFSQSEKALMQGLMVNIFLIFAFFDSPSIIQRLLMEIFIPLFLFSILVVPIKRNAKVLIIISFAALWGALTLNSASLETWQQF